MAGMEGPLSQQKLRDKKRKKIPDYVSIRHISAWCVIFGTSGSFLVLENISCTSLCSTPGPQVLHTLQILQQECFEVFQIVRKHSEVSGNLLE